MNFPPRFINCSFNFFYSKEKQKALTPYRSHGRCAISLPVVLVIVQNQSDIEDLLEIRVQLADLRGHNDLDGTKLDIQVKHNW